MQQRTKFVTAVAVLGVGLAIAMLFRRETPLAEEPVVEKIDDALVLRGSGGAGSPHTPATVPQDSPALKPKEQGSALSVPSRGDVVPALPPDLPKHYGTAEEKDDLLHGDEDFPSGAEREPPHETAFRKHKVIDGDTLARIAERYLGDASRQGEILALNRETIRTPELLPIGVTLKIPPRDADAIGRRESATLPTSDDLRMVPIRREDRPVQ